MTPTEIWKCDFFQKHGNAAILRAVDCLEKELINALSRSVQQCESPLEAAFAAWWAALASTYQWTLALTHQRDVNARGYSWRLDIVIVTTCLKTAESLEAYGGPPKICVELDGHEFHERTKEQVALRNHRDAALSLAGWKVWHISGSEFNANPEKTVQRIYTDAADVFDRALRDIGIRIGPPVAEIG